MEFEEYITNQRWALHDLLEIAINHGIYNQEFTIVHKSNYSKIWVYFYFSAYYYVVTFSTDILYINAIKGPRAFLDYIKNKIKRVGETK